MDIKGKLAHIEQQINTLGENCNRLKNENKRLRVETDVLKKRLADQDNLIKELENKNVHLHIARSEPVETGESAVIRKKIDQYIKEIDKCIELLNS
ncbi:hypothetical protein GC194_06615 [bacterium]|nr:hypothetical protein [bacterium]